MKWGGRILGTFIFLLFSASGSIASELTGITIPPLPFGIFESGGACVGRIGPTGCERNIGLLRTSAGRNFLIYTGSAEPSQGKKPRWRITDTLAFPEVPKGAEFVWSECRKSGTPDASILAIVRSSSKREWLRARDWAYRVDYDTGKFAKLDPKDIDCANSALEGED